MSNSSPTFKQRLTLIIIGALLTAVAGTYLSNESTFVQTNGIYMGGMTVNNTGNNIAISNGGNANASSTSSVNIDNRFVAGDGSTVTVCGNSLDNGSSVNCVINTK